MAVVEERRSVLVTSTLNPILHLGKPYLFGDSIPPATLVPPISIQVHLGLTIAFTALYGLLFLLIVSQLFLIHYHRHRKLSYQSVFLFTCLFWAALRTTLFSFYFKNCSITKQMHPFWYWLLFACPVFLQYFMLNILVLYFVQVAMKVTCPNKPQKYRKRIVLIFIVANVVFLITNLTSSILFAKNNKAAYMQRLTIFRVSLDYTLFFISAVILCVCIFKLTRAQTTKILVEGQGVSYCQAATVCTLISLLYLSRAVYNIIAVSPSSLPTFNFGWINVSDQGEVGQNDVIELNTENHAYVSFGMVLVVWELLPTFITIWFFRVRRPDGSLVKAVRPLHIFRCGTYGKMDTGLFTILHMEFSELREQNFNHNIDESSHSCSCLDDDKSYTLRTLFSTMKHRLGKVSSSVTSDSFNSKSYFFDNPHRYDSDDDLSVGCTPPRHGGLLDIPGFGSTRTYSVNEPNSYKRVSSYGSIPTYGGSYTSRSYPSPHVKGTTPPMLFKSNSQSNPYKPITQELD